MFLQNGGFVIIPGLSNANIPVSTHSCGATNVHNPAKTYGAMTDQQGNVYKTIVIGNQEWMAENLKTSIYRNGESLANYTDYNQWVNSTTGGCCYYDLNSQFECPYGKLYNWYAVADPRNVCPTGWHVPTDAEWRVLINFLDPTADGGNNIYNAAGGKLKSTGIQYWLSPNQDATNESGYSALPGGRLHMNGAFYNQGIYAGFWSTTEDNINDGVYYGMENEFSGAFPVSHPKIFGYSVRCIRD